MVAVSADGTVEDVAWLTVDHVSAVGTVRRAASALASRVGMREERVGEVALVVTELAANQVRHAGSGSVLLRVRHRAAGPVVEAVAVDAGPGIGDVEAALEDGVSSAGTLGIGLGAVARLASSWDVWTRPGSGTVIVASFAAERADGAPVPAAVGVTRPMAGQEVCGDAYAVREDDGVLTLLLADGLGHGPLAAAASGEAVRAFRAAPPDGPATLLTTVHRALSGTRGAAAAIARLEADQVRYAGVGNIAGVVLGGDARRAMISHPGIVGGQARTIRETTYPLPRGAVVVMHSDGVTERQTLEGYPGLLARSPLVTAAVLLRDFGVRRDDASVVVARAGAA
ncbi:ATP-binding protein [Cellulomonas hominis]|uniref:ATP-binding protein n=1 Tax=Cellulomonas hominis TaxID=156981 RepID=UPI001443DE18|nr:SpoIIE family protein phosphatase [Cellulomonas hominis]